MTDEFDGIEEASREDQMELMEEWFRNHFEDPAERMPYESAEGGYQYIWGGPFNATEELYAKFSGRVPDEVIEELGNKLSDENPEWAPVASEDDYDRSLLDVVRANQDAFDTFNGAIQNVQEMLAEIADKPQLEPVYALLFANIISTLETYLSDTFINLVLKDEKLLRRFLETTPEFKQRSIAFSEVLAIAEKVPEEVKRYLLDVVWHNLAKVQAMYRNTLGVDFGRAITGVARAIPTRHDIVHRNGKQKDGTKVFVDSAKVEALISDVRALIEIVEENLI